MVGPAEADSSNVCARAVAGMQSISTVIKGETTRTVRTSAHEGANHGTSGSRPDDLVISARQLSGIRRGRADNEGCLRVTDGPACTTMALNKARRYARRW